VETAVQRGFKSKHCHCVMIEIARAGGQVDDMKSAEVRDFIHDGRADFTQSGGACCEIWWYKVGDDRQMTYGNFPRDSLSHHGNDSLSPSCLGPPDTWRRNRLAPLRLFFDIAVELRGRTEVADL